MKIPLLDNVIGQSASSLGIAFSGGGARGFAHIGVILAMEKFNIKPDIIAGVSAGAIAASLYGAGLYGKEIIEVFQEFNKLSDFTDWAIPRESILRLDKFRQMLESWLPVRNIEDCRIPTVICATDFDHGKSVGFTKGEMAIRVVASCSIPIIFPPVKLNGVNYVDGGVLRNLPAWAIRENCRTLIGVNCSPLSRKYSYKKSIIDIAFRSYSLMSKANTLQDINLCDHLIQNDGLAQYKTFGVADMKKIIVKGYDSACSLFETLF